MDHIAIMNKSLGLISKILSKEKTIETRWYKTKRAPWNRIKKGDMVYFKESGGLITAKAKVNNVLQFQNLTRNVMDDIIQNHSKGICFTSLGSPDFYDYFKDKNYAILIFLEDAVPIHPFQIDKSGYGTGAAWLCIQDINKIKISL